MRSTGEVMGIDRTFGRAFYKAELAAGTMLPTDGTVFLSLADTDKPAGLVVAQRLRELGLGIAATEGTADYLARFGDPVDEVVGQGAATGDGGDRGRPDRRRQGQLRRQHARRARAAAATASRSARRRALHRVSCVTTVDAALAAVQGMAEQRGEPLTVALAAGVPRADDARRVRAPASPA